MSYTSMRTTGLAVLFLILTASASWAQSVRVGDTAAHPRREGAIRLATYNIENLFDDRDDPSLSGKFDDWYDKDKGLRAKPATQQEAVAASIRKADPDIIGLEEIESYDALIEFREKYLADMGYVYAVSIDVGQERGIQQAVLSRFPIRQATVWPNMPLGGVHPENYGTGKNWYAGEPILYRRSPLYVRIEVPANAAGNAKPYELDLFAIHHKSGRYNDYWRDKEAARLVEMIKDIEKADPTRNIAVMGDFNASPEDKCVQMYIDAGMHHVIDRTTTDPKTTTHSSGRSIDFILVNQALAKEIVPNSAFVLGTPVLDEDKDWRTTPPPPGYASDHMEVIVDITPVEH